MGVGGSVGRLVGWLRERDRKQGTECVRWCWCCCGGICLGSSFVLVDGVSELAEKRYGEMQIKNLVIQSQHSTFFYPELYTLCPCINIYLCTAINSALGI